MSSAVRPSLEDHHQATQNDCKVPLYISLNLHVFSISSVEFEEGGGGRLGAVGWQMNV